MCGVLMKKLSVLLLMVFFGACAYGKEEGEYFRALELVARGAVNGYLDDDLSILRLEPFSNFSCSIRGCAVTDDWPYIFVPNVTELNLNLPSGRSGYFEVHRLRFSQTYKKPLAIDFDLLRSSVFFRWETAIPRLSIHESIPVLYVAYGSRVRRVFAVLAVFGKVQEVMGSRQVEIEKVELNIFKGADLVLSDPLF